MFSKDPQLVIIFKNLEKGIPMVIFSYKKGPLGEIHSNLQKCKTLLTYITIFFLSKQAYKV